MLQHLNVFLLVNKIHLLKITVHIYYTRLNTYQDRTSNHGPIGCTQVFSYFYKAKPLNMSVLIQKERHLKQPWGQISQPACYFPSILQIAQRQLFLWCISMQGLFRRALTTLGQAVCKFHLDGCLMKALHKAYIYKGIHSKSLLNLWLQRELLVQNLVYTLFWYIDMTTPFTVKQF